MNVGVHLTGTFDAFVEVRDVEDEDEAVDEANMLLEDALGEAFDEYEVDVTASETEEEED